MLGSQAMKHHVTRTACPQYRDALVDFSDNALPATKRADVENHVAICPACRAELARLDRSLARLAGGVAPATTVAVVRQPHPPTHSTRWAMAVAVTGLICCVSIWWSGQRPIEVSQSNIPATQADPKLSQHDALWQIALIEQQARLQSSLEMLPKDEAFEEQRREDERLLAKFQSMARDVQSGNFQ